MRYKRIKVRDFKGIDEREVAIGGGVTVLVGPNEVGKSSLLEAIDVLRKFKDSSRAAAIRNIRPVGRDASPFVELELQTGPYDVTYRKQWWRSPKTELEVKKDGGPVKHFTGDEAHEKYLAILEETVDLNLLDQVNVLQGQSLQQAKLADVPALQQALGDNPDDGTGDVLMERVEKEYSTYYTPSGKEAVILSRSRSKVADLREDLNRTQRRADEAARFTEEHAKNEAEVRRLLKKLDQDRIALKAAEVQEAEIAAVKDGLEQAQTERKDLQEEEKQKRTLLLERKQLRDELEGLANQQTEKEQELRLQLARVEELEEKHVQDLLAVQTAQVKWDEARKISRTTQDRITHFRDREELRATSALIARANTAEEALRKSQEAAASSTLTDSILNDLQEAKQRHDLAQAAWKMAAPTVTITRTGPKKVTIFGVDDNPDAATEVEVDGSATTQVFGKLRVEVEGAADLEVSAGSSPEELESELRSAQEDLARSLEEAGVASLAEAQERNAQCHRNQAELVRRRDILNEILADASLEELRSREAELRGKLRENDLAADETVNRSDLEASLQECLQQEEELEETVRQLRVSADTTQRKVEGSQQKLSAVRTGLEQLEAQALHLTYRLEASLEDTSDELLAEQLQDLDRELEQASQKVEDLNARIDTHQVEQLQLVLENLRQSVETKQDRLQTLRDRNLELSALLDDRSEEGLFDRMQDLEANLEEAEASLSRLEKRAAATKLLRDTLAEYKQVAQEKYVQPFEAGINQLGRIMFGPDFAVHIDRHLQIHSRTLDGINLEFAHLSMGAREQLSLLGRLACAKLIDPQAGAPVVLDDVLGFADPDRLADINLVLNSVGKDAQVIVMTCQGERFEDVGSAHFVRL